MNTLVSDEQPVNLHAFDCGTVELLVSQPGADTLRFPLAEGKSTVGSSPSCQIRLESAAMRPLQCLIVRKGHEFTVTRWAAGVQLNGLDFTTAPFRPRDLLSIGTVSLELAGPAMLSNEQEAGEQSPVALIDEVEAKVAAEVADAGFPTPSTDQQINGSNPDLARLRSANRQTRQRFRRLVDALRQLRNEAHGLDQQVGTLTEQLQSAQHTQESLRAELHQSEAIAAERESQIGEELDRAIAELTASYAKADEASREIESLRARNEQVQEQIGQLTTELAHVRELSNGHEAERLQFEEQLADREAHLAQVREELSLLQQKFEASVADLRGQNESLQEKLNGAQQEREREVADLRQGLEASVVELHEQNESLRNELGELCAERDQQIAELHELNDSLRNNAAAFAAERDQRIAELDGLRASLQNELASAVEERDRQLFELHDLCESLRNNAAAITVDRDQQIAELTRHFEARQADLTAVIAERERELQELRSGTEESTHQLRNEAETLATQLAEQAAERDRAIDELAEAHRVAIEDSASQIQALQQQLAEAAAEREAQIAALQSKLEQTRSALAEAEQFRSQPDPEKIELESELQVVRAERQKLAEEKHHLVLQLEDAEKRSKLLEIDIRSVNAEWQRTQHTVAQLQDELLTVQARAADLDAKLCDFQCSAEIDRAADGDAFASDLATMQSELEKREQALAKSQDESNQLHGQLSATEQELAACRTRIEELSQQIAASQTAATEFEIERSRQETLVSEGAAQIEALRETAGEAERTRLVDAIGDYEARISKLTTAATQTQQSHAAELADRDDRIAALSAELQSAKLNLSTDTSRDEAHHAELATVLMQTEQRLACEMQSKETLIAEHTAQLAKLQDAVSAELIARDAKIAELSSQLESLRSGDVSKLSFQQQACDDLRQQLLESQGKAAVEISRREEQISELARELHETQDQLADCAAQGERVAELYRQAQADLAALASTEPAAVPVSKRNATQAIEAGNESLQTAEQVSTTPRDDDPRDDDEPRLERALACLTSEPEVDESTKTVPFQPTSFIDRYSHIFDEGNGAEAPEAAATPQLQDIDGDDSAALEAYMANMMKRVRGETSSDSIVPPVPRDPESDQAPQFNNPVARMSTLTQRVAVPTDTDTDEAVEEKLICLNELKQTSQKPPLPTSLSAMRELANISARQAIAKHRKRRHFEGALSKLLVSGIAGGTATYMLLTADDYLSPYFLAGCGVAVVSAYWGVKLLGILLEMIRDGINNEGAPVELDDSSDALPIDGISS